MKRPVRRRLQRLVQRSSDKNHARRANAFLLAFDGISISEIARLLRSTRKSVREWCCLFRQFGEAGLVPETRGRHKETVTDEVCARLLDLINQETKQYFGCTYRGLVEFVSIIAKKAKLFIPEEQITSQTSLSKLFAIRRFLTHYGKSRLSLSSDQ